MSLELANALAKRFIARSDAKARQGSNGQYSPVRVDPRDRNSATSPWTRDDVLAHLDGKETYGHYFLDKDDSTKLFALDIDLEKTGNMPQGARDDTWSQEQLIAWEESFVAGNPREAWRNRAHPARTWMKTEFREIVGALASVIVNDMDCECAVAYSGSKGVHVYGFTGRTSAHEAIVGAELALQLVGGFVKDPGAQPRASTWKHETRWQHLSVEVYPKQANLSGGGFGNLMRLPLGRNQKSPDPTFFVDLNAPLNQLKPVDSLWALTEGAANPWKVAP